MTGALQRYPCRGTVSIQERASEPERLPQDRHLEGEIAFLHLRVRPEGVENFRLPHRPALVLDQDPEQVKALRRKADTCVFLQQPVRHSVEPEWPELINAAGLATLIDS